KGVVLPVVARRAAVAMAPRSAEGDRHKAEVEGPERGHQCTNSPTPLLASVRLLQARGARTVIYGMESNLRAGIRREANLRWRNPMKLIETSRRTAAIAIFVALGGCSSWQTADKETGKATGAVGGVVAGEVVASPVGAVVGGVGGAVVGHETTGYPPSGTTYERRVAAVPPTAYDSSTIRAVQQALNDRGYNAGPVDGQWGAATQDAVRRFQQVAGLPATGELTPSTLSALGVS